MGNWLRRFIGIDSLENAINKNKRETQKEIENISKLLENNKSSSNVEIEPISEIQLSNDSGKIDFKLCDNFNLDKNWTLLSSAIKSDNLFSQAASASGFAATTAYSTNGLYLATVNVNSLMVYKNGAISSITTKGGQFGQHAGFVSANTSVFTPILAFQFASMITGQYYFNGLSKQLTSIHKSINELISLHHNERLAKLRYINFKISELNERSYFTTEDYILIDKLKYDLSTIRFEYLLAAEQEINKSLDKVNDVDNSDTIEIISEETNSIERIKISAKHQARKLFSIIGEKFDNLYQDSILEHGVDSVRKLTENSSKKAAKLTSAIIEGKYFFYSDVALKAEHLYQLSRLLEFKMNLSDKEPDSNRIGKIKEIYDSISTFNNEDSIFDEIESLNSQLRKKLVTDITILKENSITNKNKIIANGQLVKNKLNECEDLISRKHMLFEDFKEIKSVFGKPKQILFDNRNDRTQIYTKND
ncbi:hypothetical protein [Aequorivita sinensis]|uniref:hypothetical protein n=1 Tax=Aequorivita sinensis TaxID=1382458 RepID=UPI002300F097|nr:hypothetical protein [Aequorivita sinensis]